MRLAEINKPHEEWAKSHWRVVRVGSRVTCDPPPQDTDEDFLVFTTDHDVSGHFLAQGFAQDGLPEFYTGNNNGNFRSFRRGHLNAIVTDRQSFFDLFLSATDLAKRFNLMAKKDRIALFQAVLYGVGPHNLAGQE